MKMREWLPAGCAAGALLAGITVTSGTQAHESGPQMLDPALAV